MFQSCTRLTTLDLSNFDTSGIDDVTYMMPRFGSCNSLHTLKLNNCDYNTIKRIILYSNLPTTAIEGVTRKIYVNRDNVADLSAPTNWIFVDCETDEVIE
jgi:surface protein